MSQSIVNVWVHAVFSTKDRMPLINPALEQQLFDHIRTHMERDFHIPVAAINGMNDHIHILFRLPADISIMQAMKNIKGESSHWVNQHDLTRMKFAWQSGYGAFSVHWRETGSVIAYIEGQKEHHRILTFTEECRELFERFGMETDESVSGVSGA